MEPLVQMNHITKRFPGVVALDDITFDVRPGEVHVLLGENGAGKSTLMKVLSGVYQPDGGTVVVEGREFGHLTPRLSSACGISIIYQELSVIDELSIQENIFLGRIPHRRQLGMRLLDARAMKQQAKRLLDGIGLARDPGEAVRGLNISEKQMVEIAKSLAFNAKVIVMDEPTSSLSEQEVEHLFRIIRALKESGKGVVYISHKLGEIMEIGDRVTVLKDGGYVDTLNVRDVTEDELITMMVGREFSDKYHGGAGGHETGEVIFEVSHLSRRDKYVEDASFRLRRGEVLGFSGLIGAGRSELMSAVFGAHAVSGGEITLHGNRLRIRNPYDALKQGIGMVTENRRETGFFGNFSIRRNLSIAKQLKATRGGGLFGLVDYRDELVTAQRMQRDVQIKCASLEQNITQLSGGNQQKVILGKWLAAGVKLLIFDEPTKGIDVGTKAEIYKLMRALAENGVGVILISSEMPELLSVCDRILVMCEGRISAEFRGGEATEEKLVKAAVPQAGNAGGKQDGSD